MEYFNYPARRVTTFPPKCTKARSCNRKLTLKVYLLDQDTSTSKRKVANSSLKFTMTDKHKVASKTEAKNWYYNTFVFLILSPFPPSPITT